jgi:hypothetical protein
MSGVHANALEGVHERFECMREIQVVVNLRQGALGAPSLNSSVPMRVPTASGVLIAEEISGAVCAAANRSIASRVKVTTEVASVADFMG